MKNIAQLKQSFILVIFATIAVFNYSFGVNADEIREIIKQERQHHQENKIRHYEEVLKKLNEAKEEIEKKEEASCWRNAIYQCAHYIADRNNSPANRLVAVILLPPLVLGQLTNTEIPKERKRHKEILERKIEKISRKLNKKTAQNI